MLPAMPLILADNDYSGLIKGVLFIVILLATLIGKAIQQQRKETGQGRPMPREDDQEPLDLRPDATQPPAPGMSVEDIALAMRRAERERIARQREAGRQAGRPQAAQQQAAQLAAAQQRAAQQRAAQLRAAQQRAASMPIPTQQAMGGQPLARPSQRIASSTQRRQVQAVQPTTNVQPAQAAESVEQRHLHLSAVGQGVAAEDTRMRGHLQQEDAERTHRLSGEALGHLRGMGLAAAAAPAVAVTPVGVIRLDNASELARAVLYSEILGPPLAMREQQPAWEK